MPRKYPPEFRQRAVRLLVEALPDHETEYTAIRHVADKLGISPEALRRWRRVSEVDSGERPGMTSEENAELKRVNEVLRAASAYFASEIAPTRRTS